MNSEYLLLIEDDQDLRAALEVTLSIAELPFLSAPSAEAGLKILSGKPNCIAVISDIRLPGMSGLQCLEALQRTWPHLPVVLMTAFADTHVAVQALKGGARDLILKPFKPDQLVEVARRYAESRISNFSGDGSPICFDPKSKLLLERANRVAKTDATVLLLGESGTGKEVIASFIHKQSHRSNGPFVAINCAAIPSTLLEATLFGYEKGAFTGANRPQPGKFEIASSGTIFLDEIGEMALELQAKLLRILQERQVERVGSHESISLDVRVIAATNVDLTKRVSSGLFREDLFYRINVFPLQISPLRDRPGDILPLAEYFLLKYRGQMGQPEARLSDATKALLCVQPWPGNARELENVIQRGLLLSDGRLIEPNDMALDDPRPANAEYEQGVDSSASKNKPPLGSAISAIGFPAEPSGHQQEVQMGSNADLPNDVKDLEREHILTVLRRVNGHRKRAVEILGISERTLRYKLRQWREAGHNIP